MPNDPILHLLSLARKAGKLEIGEEPVGALCRARHARLVLLAANATPNTYRRAAHFSEAGNVLSLSLPHSKEELGFYFGRGAIAMMALSDAGLAASVVDKLAAIDPVRYGPAAEQLRVKADRMLQRQREKRQHEKNLRMGKVRRAPDPKPPRDEAPPPPAAEHKAPRVPKTPGARFRPTTKTSHSAPPSAPKPPRPGSSAPHARQDGPARGGKPSFKPGPGGRKLSGKFRKP